MKKQLFIKSFLIVALLISLFFIPTLKVNGMGEYKDDFYRQLSSNETVIYNTVTWDNIIAETRTNQTAGSVAGYGSEGSIDTSAWYKQQVNVLNVPRYVDKDGEQLYKVVSWSVQDTANDRWKFAGATAIAADYEANNPDYIVLGGINADFYDWHTTLDYPNCGNGVEVRDGEVIRAVFNGRGAAAIFNTTEETNQLAFDFPITTEHFSSSFYLSVFNEDGEVIKEVEIPTLNKASLVDGETSAYFGSIEIVYEYAANGSHVLNSYGEWSISERIYHAPTLAEGNTYNVNNGELVIYQASENSYYGRGVINALNESEVGRQSFAIVTKDAELQQLLAEDVEVRVQRKLIGDFAGATDVMGTWRALVEDGEFCDLYSSEAYFTVRAPRSIIGCKDDGTITLITMDGRQADKNYYGTTQEEINGFLDAYGVTNAYLLDGGGSTTFFVRENNKFVIKNSPSDGSQRSVGNALLVVAKKDNTLTASNIELSQNSATFTIQSSDEDVTKAYVKVNDELHEVIDNKVTISGLSSNTEYAYTLYYSTKLSGSSLIPTTSTASFTTLKSSPSVEVGTFTYDDNYIYPSLNINDPDSAIEIIMITCGNKTLVYNREDLEENKIAFTGNLECSIVYTYKLGKNSPREEVELSYVIPTHSEPKKGCSSSLVFISAMILASLMGIVIFKRKK